MIRYNRFNHHRSTMRAAQKQHTWKVCRSSCPEVVFCVDFGNSYLPRFTNDVIFSCAWQLTDAAANNSKQADKGICRLAIRIYLFSVRWGVYIPNYIISLLFSTTHPHNQATYFAFFLTWPNRPANVSCFLVGIAAILDFRRETSHRS